MFSSYIDEAKEILSSLQKASQTTLTDVDVSIEPWPKDPMQVILQNETAVELGSPGTASISMVLLTADSSLVDDGKVTLIGSDTGETVSPEEWAKLNGTHVYDILCSFGGRMERRYVAR